ncbi:MAG: substrate-binding domain-containing protein [Ginsengibacter sp.]
MPSKIFFQTSGFIIVIVFFSLINYSCTRKNGKKEFVIGYSQCTTHDAWRKYMQKEMERELAFHPEIKLIVKDANLNSEKQIEQIQEFMNEKVDLLIASPAGAEAITPIINKVYAKGIPVILVDRGINSEDYTAFIGASNYKVGQEAGTYACSLLKGQGNVLEIGGTDVGSSADIGRHAGFTDVIKQHKGIKYVARISEDWDSDSSEAAKNLTDQLIKDSNIQLIYTQNDRIGLGCYNICKKLGIADKIFIIGTDGLPGHNGGIDLVNRGELKATILYPTGGKEAIQTAVNILEHKPYQKQNELFSNIIDSSNVSMMNLQSQKTLSLQNDIERQQNRLEEQIKIYDNQKTFNNILLLALCLVVILGATVYFSWRKNKRITNRLRFQNDEISRQSLQLTEVSAKAEQAHQAKLNFFTNISHEFRTPLTLIFAPLGELISNPRLQKETKQTLQLVEKNVMRLYRLVTQLMDFRKIEFKKMKLTVSENDLVSFVQEIVFSFNPLAKNKNIDLKFFTSERSLFIWFDMGMMDKVIFNIISNAFKFTKENGNIYVSLSKKENIAVITIEDDGIGMTREVIDHAFEPFFQGEYENYKGTGLGLALSKELIELHKGSITAKSEKGKGCVFEIKLQMGNSHFEESEFGEVSEELTSDKEHNIYSRELYDIESLEDTEDELIPKYQTILIIEDNDEMREYLRSRLSHNYTTIEAENSMKALQMAFDNVPDVILSDIVIPGKNGLELTKIFKSDVRTSHIPIILLTAKDQDAQKIEGMEIQADAYITKPFNLVFLQKTIESLIKNREKIKEHYSGEIFSEEKFTVSKKSDRKFLIDFTAIVENNLSNDHFGINDICAEMGITRIQLYRKIKALLNTSVNEYIVTTRLQKAKYYMHHENLTISEIAFKSGFSSAAYFATVFKSKFGVTPSAFKEN